MTSGGWIDQIYLESELASGYQGQRVLERLLKELTPVCGLPEIEIAHDRRPCNTSTMVLDAWGMQPDESLGSGQDGVPYDALYLIGFLDGKATRETSLSLQACGDAIRGMAWFYQRSARDGGGSVKPLHEITSPSEASYNAARYISDQRATPLEQSWKRSMVVIPSTIIFSSGPVEVDLGLERFDQKTGKSTMAWRSLRIVDPAHADVLFPEGEPAPPVLETLKPGALSAPVPSANDSPHN